MTPEQNWKPSYSDVEGIPNILSQQDTRSCTSAYSGECGREHAVENTLKKNHNSSDL